MTKSDYEKLCDQLGKGNMLLKEILLSIKNEMISAHKVFHHGPAEESDFNLGVQHAIAVISDIINSHVGKNSILTCQNFKNVAKTSACPFTISEGGLN